MESQRKGVAALSPVGELPARCNDLPGALLAFRLPLSFASAASAAALSAAIAAATAGSDGRLAKWRQARQIQMS